MRPLLAFISGASFGVFLRGMGIAIAVGSARLLFASLVPLFYSFALILSKRKEVSENERGV